MASASRRFSVDEMVAAFGRRDTSGLGFIDYGLMGLGSALAVWSAGMAIAQDRIGLFSAAWVLAGTLFSFFLRYLGRGKQWLRIDAILYTIAGIGSAVFSIQLQSLMPSGGFPRELFAAGWLSWMLILGSFVSWRDSTLLFQAVPAIALFGLVGCYDTFRAVVFPFYGFLVCLATFFARAHGRQMLQESVLSGFFARGLAPGAPAPSPETTPGLSAKLREGPWRWVAGPEWALASALVVVLISLLGAPMVQRSVQQVAGFVTVNMPRLPRSSTIPPIVGGAEATAQRIGLGPITLTEKPVLEAGIDHVRYLRSSTYDTYTGRGWARSQQATVPLNVQSDSVSAVLEMMDADRIRYFNYTIRPLQSLRIVPAPGLTTDIPLNARLKADDSIELQSMLSRDFEGKSVEISEYPARADAPELVPDILGRVTDTANITPRMQQLVDQVTAGLSSDWEKAQAIKRAIEERIQYSVRAPAAPGGVNVVDYMLFEQKVAYCDVFASAMVTLARAAGIPARYAVGFLPKPDTRLPNGRFVVQEKDAHAWAELLFDGLGWVPFDATEGADNLDGEGVGASTESGPWYKHPILLRALDVSIVLIVLGALLYGYRTYRYRQEHPNYRHELDSAYLDFSSALHRYTGVRRGIGVTADEYLQAVAPKVSALEQPLREINAAFVSAYYAPSTLDGTTVETLRAKVAAFRKDLRELKRARAK